jgi:hypothetical protein
MRALLELENSTDEEIAARISNEIENYIRQKASAVLTQVKSGYDRFVSLARNGTLFFDKSLMQDRPIEIVNTPDRYKSFIHIRDGAYSGPSEIHELQEWANIKNQVQDIVNLSALVTSQDGQMILLKRIFDSPEYTIAHAKRDLKLLQLHPPQKVSEVTDLVAWTENAGQESKSYADKLRGISVETKKMIMDDVTEKFDTFKEGINKQTSLAIGNYHKAKDIVKSTLSQGIIFNDYGGRIVELAKQRTTYYNLNLYNYIISHEPTKFEAATKDDFEMAESFSKLLNQENYFLPLHMVDQASSVIVKYQFSFDCSRFEADHKAAAEAFKSAFLTETIDCPFFTSTDLPTHCTIAQLKELKNFDRFKVHGKTMPYWISTIDNAIGTLMWRIRDKFQPHKQLSLVSLCGL